MTRKFGLDNAEPLSLFPPGNYVGEVRELLDSVLHPEKAGGDHQVNIVRTARIPVADFHALCATFAVAH